MEFLGENRIWQKNNTYCYTLPNGTYKTFTKKITNQQLKKALHNVDYYNTYKKYVQLNGTKFGDLDKARMYPFAVLLNTWIYNNLIHNVENFIPNYNDFCNLYILNYCHPTENGLTFNENACLDKIEFSDIAMRIRIGYPYGSFLREFYLKNCFIEYFEKKNVDINVCYSIHDDYYNAIDIIFEKNKRYLGVCVLDASKKSKKMKQKKDTNRHKTIGNNIVISNKDGFIKDKNIIPRMNFYTGVFGNDIEHIGEINVPKLETIYKFADEVVQYFEH